VQETKAFAKRQMTWFKKIKETIVIDDADFDDTEELLGEVVDNKKFRNFCGKHEIKIPV
jgi:tRNA A37 N6-isopentenylltransferase MiaA